MPSASSLRLLMASLASSAGLFAPPLQAQADPAEPSTADCKALIDFIVAETVLFHDFTDENTGEYLDPLEHGPSTPERMRNYSEALKTTVHSVQIIQGRLGDPALAERFDSLKAAFSSYHALFEKILAEGSDYESPTVKNRWQPKIDAEEARLEAAGAVFGDELNTPACSAAAKQYKAELEDDLADTD